MTIPSFKLLPREPGAGVLVSLHRDRVLSLSLSLRTRQGQVMEWMTSILQEVQVFQTRKGVHRQLQLEEGHETVEESGSPVQYSTVQYSTVQYIPVQQ